MTIMKTTRNLRKRKKSLASGTLRGWRTTLPLFTTGSDKQQKQNLSSQTSNLLRETGSSSVNSPSHQVKLSFFSKVATIFTGSNLIIKSKQFSQRRTISSKHEIENSEDIPTCNCSTGPECWLIDFCLRVILHSQMCQHEPEFLVYKDQCITSIN